MARAAQRARHSGPRDAGAICDRESADFRHDVSEGCELCAVQSHAFLGSHGSRRLRLALAPSGIDAALSHVGLPRSRRPFSWRSAVWMLWHLLEDPATREPSLWGMATLPSGSHFITSRRRTARRHLLIRRKSEEHELSVVYLPRSKRRNRASENRPPLPCLTTISSSEGMT